MPLIKKIAFTLLFVSAFLSFSSHMVFAKAEYNFEIAHLLDDYTQSFSSAELRNMLIENELKKPEIAKIILLADFDAYSAKALMAMSMEIEFKTLVENKEGNKKEIASYKAEAFVKNADEIIPRMQENMAKNLLLYRLIQIEKDTDKMLKSIQESLNLLNNSKKLDSTNPLFALTEEKMQMLQALNLLFEELTDESNTQKTWKDPEGFIALLEPLASYSNVPLSLLNSLAEVYLYMERPQKALQLIEEAYKKHEEANLFTDYLNILIALMRKEVALADNDVKKAIMKLDTNALYANFMRPYFLVLEGAIAQTQEDFSTMCRAYEEACVFNHCAPFFAVQDVCANIGL